MGDLQVANILQLANIKKENGKKNLEYQIDEKTSQSTTGTKERKFRYWVMDSSAPSQKGRFEKVFYMREINKAPIWG